MVDVRQGVNKQVIGERAWAMGFREIAVQERKRATVVSRWFCVPKCATVVSRWFRVCRFSMVLCRIKISQGRWEKGSSRFWSTLQVQIEGRGEEGGGGLKEAIDIGVNIVGVYNLPKMDVMGSCDPYVVYHPKPQPLNPKPSTANPEP
jgi:hypothetical protein